MANYFYDVDDIKTDGSFQRKESIFRNWISKDGKFPPEKGRYHLYVAFGCPWAHRVLILRKMKKLENVISMDVVHFIKSQHGWHFDDKDEGCTIDTANGGQKYLKDIYKLVDPNYKGRITVPILFDKKLKTIVNNESSDLIRILNSEFNDFCEDNSAKILDLYPQCLKNEIDSLNVWIYHMINDGVDQCGFAKSQNAYEKAVLQVFQGLDRVEYILSKKRFLTGYQLTEADVRLYPTLIRFDCVYYSLFKCNFKRIVDYPNIQGYMKVLYQMESFKTTTNFKHIKTQYYSNVELNPSKIVPLGPILDLEFPHQRNLF